MQDEQVPVSNQAVAEFSARRNSFLSTHSEAVYSFPPIPNEAAQYVSLKRIARGEAAKQLENILNQINDADESNRRLMKAFDKMDDNLEKIQQSLRQERHKLARRTRPSSRRAQRCTLL